MRIVPLAIDGVFAIEVDRFSDDRGFFARTFDVDEFAALGLSSTVVQGSVAHNHTAGTVRGMHWQAEPALEAKLVRCTRGAVLDQIVDLRPGSPTRLRSVAVELTEDNLTTLYVPPLFAHGYQTLADATEVTYLMDAPHQPDAARGLRFDDPALGLHWPLPVSVIADKDLRWPLLDTQPPGPPGSGIRPEES